jgi:predicted amidohydrolase YtcJ
MAKFTRGEFIGLSAAAAVGMTACTPGEGGGGSGGQGAAGAMTDDNANLAGAAHVAAGAEPDVVVVNARVYTVEEAQPIAEAFAVKHGRFSAVGSTDDVRYLAGPGTTIIDAAGMTVTPGFIDAHSHPAGAGLNELISVNVNFRTIAEIQQAMAARAADTPPGMWVNGFMYDDTKLEDGRPVNRYDLDVAVPDGPASIRHRGGHTSVYNSWALDTAGVAAETPDPRGGHIVKDENGVPTGLMQERTGGLFNGVGERRPPATDEMRREGVALITQQMSAAGLTSFHDAGVGSVTTYDDSYREGRLHCRVYMLLRGAFSRMRDAGVRTGFGDEWLRVGAVKMGADGSASERTMRMSTPYVGRPDDYGILTMDQDEIHERVEEAHRAGFQIGIHANGDVTIDMVLNAYERMQREFPRPDPRHRIEHCSLVNDDLLTRIKAVGAIPTPFYTYVHYHGNKWVEYGAEKMRMMFAHRSFLDHDIPVAGASDFVPGPYEPLMALQSLVTRKDFAGRVWGENQRVTVDEAIRICTINGAHASFEENAKGSIKAGKLADFVILAEDPHDVDPDTIKEIDVVRTVVGGRTMHSLEG